ncbi:MAG: DUF4917 domain-containing protein [Alphaproteobacteria bacterium]|nr:MAG: DUF4917 domain-containing protein [Alphaproteobacteria bacterium]
MKLESFDDVYASIGKNRTREFHLLLGNGFSMAYDSEIFSYNALHDFISNFDDKDLITILSVVETKNFELIMQQLDVFSTLIEAFGGDRTLKEKVDSASEKLKNSLLNAVKDLHPNHVFSVPKENSEACSKFIKLFMDTNGNVFSTNYDLLLYWILMRNEVVDHCDGFGRELENPGEFLPADQQIWSDLLWGVNREKQNVFYVHGALPFFDTGKTIVKEEYDTEGYLLENISERMENGEYPIFVTAGNGDQKLSHILHNQYLTDCYENLCSIEGSLVTFGFNFGQYDEHIIDAINKAAKHGKRMGKKLHSIYIGVYSEKDKEYIESIESKFMLKVHIYDAKTANVWGI